MVEAALNAAAMATIAHQLSGEARTAPGQPQRDRIRPPEGCTPAPGPTNGWPSEIENDRQWAQLCAVVGWPSSTGADDHELDGADLGSGSARQAHLEALERWLTEATRGWDAGALAELLADAGVPAAVVVPPPLVADNPQVRHRGLFETEEHPVTGRQRLPGLPFAMSGIGSWVRTPAPLLGQHNDEVLGDLGIGATERATLREEGIIGEQLLGA